MADEKQPTQDDASLSASEKTLPAANKNVADENATDDAPRLAGLVAVVSAKGVVAELDRIMTSGDGIEYPTGTRLNLVTLALCLSVFLMALDNTIIATAIPRITDQFHSLPGESSQKALGAVLTVSKMSAGMVPRTC